MGRRKGEPAENENFHMRLNMKKPSEKRIWMALQEHRGYKTTTKWAKEAFLEFIEKQETEEVLSEYMPRPLPPDKE